MSQTDHRLFKLLTALFVLILVSGCKEGSSSSGFSGSGSSPSISSTAIGNSVFFSNGESCTKIGSSWFCSDGTTYTTIGNSMFDSDGTTYTAIGNSVFDSNGTTYTTIGNFIFDSNGNSCTKIGNSWFCQQSEMVCQQRLTFLRKYDQIPRALIKTPRTSKSIEPKKIYVSCSEVNSGGPGSMSCPISRKGP